MNLRFLTLITAILLLVSAIGHFSFYDYERSSEYLADNPEEWWRIKYFLFKPLLVEVSLAIFLLTLFAKQK